jgi:hypothetical protein
VGRYYADKAGAVYLIAKHNDKDVDGRWYESKPFAYWHQTGRCDPDQASKWDLIREVKIVPVRGGGKGRRK